MTQRGYVFASFIFDQNWMMVEITLQKGERNGSEKNSMAFAVFVDLLFHALATNLL